MANAANFDTVNTLWANRKRGYGSASAGIKRKRKFIDRINSSKLQGQKVVLYCHKEIKLFIPGDAIESNCNILTVFL